MTWGCKVGADVLDGRYRCVRVRSGCAMGVWVECDGVGECHMLESRERGLIMRFDVGE